MTITKRKFLVSLLIVIYEIGAMIGFTMIALAVLSLQSFCKDLSGWYILTLSLMIGFSITAMIFATIVKLMKGIPT